MEVNQFLEKCLYCCYALYLDMHQYRLCNRNYISVLYEFKTIKTATIAMYGKFEGNTSLIRVNVNTSVEKKLIINGRTVNINMKKIHSLTFILNPLKIIIRVRW